MREFALNPTLMFNEVPFMERFDAAAQARFKGIGCKALSFANIPGTRRLGGMRLPSCPSESTVAGFEWMQRLG